MQPKVKFPHEGCSLDVLRSRVGTVSLLALLEGSGAREGNQPRVTRGQPPWLDGHQALDLQALLAWTSLIPVAHFGPRTPPVGVSGPSRGG